LPQQCRGFIAKGLNLNKPERHRGGNPAA